MLLIYLIVIRVYYALVLLVSLFNKKAAQWINGRKTTMFKQHQHSIWFHFASLGEFEQGRPVLERMRQVYPGKPIVVTFFSPSGYEIRKNTPLADAVYYLPLDTPTNARRFIAAIQPDIAIFTKYEYWYCYFKQLHEQQIPLYIISGIFRPQQIFFKWYGGLHRQMLGMVNRFFVQDEDSRKLLEDLNITNVTVSGDTRFDRVWANAQQPRTLPLIAEFKAGQPLFIGGSTWPPDEDLIVSLINQYPSWKFIFAPHEIGADKIDRLAATLPAEKTVRFSQIETLTAPLASYQVLIIDNIGMLSSLYQYAEIAYIGGGFGAGIHNTLEAAAFGMPVIFGPKYQKFREARELIAIGAGFSIATAGELQEIAGRFINKNTLRTAAADKARNYVAEHVGATDAIVGWVTATSGE